MYPVSTIRRTPHRLLGLALLCSFFGSTLSGCVGLTELQNSVSQLDQSVHGAATAEASFLTAVQAADCDSQFYTAVYRFSVNSAENFQLAAYCSPRVLTSDQYRVRKNLMDALTLYADKLQALASSSDDKQLEANSQTLASNLKALGAAPGAVNLSATVKPEIVAGVQAAFVAIAELALDHKKYTEVTKAARDMQPHIDAIVRALQAENDGFANSLVADHEVLEGQLRLAVASATGISAKFFAAIQARSVLATSSGLTDQSLATVDWTNTAFAKPITDALPAIQTANSAIARGVPASVSSAAHDLYARAEAAKDLYNNLANAK